MRAAVLTIRKKSKHIQSRATSLNDSSQCNSLSPAWSSCISGSDFQTSFGVFTGWGKGETFQHVAAVWITFQQECSANTCSGLETLHCSQTSLTQGWESINSIPLFNTLSYNVNIPKGPFFNTPFSYDITGLLYIHFSCHRIYMIIRPLSASGNPRLGSAKEDSCILCNT